MKSFFIWCNILIWLFIVYIFHSADSKSVLDFKRKTGLTRKQARRFIARSEQLRAMAHAQDGL